MIVTKENNPKHPKTDPDHVTKENLAEKRGYWLRAAVARCKEHWDVYKKRLGVKPVLFIMAKKNAYADALGASRCPPRPAAPPLRCEATMARNLPTATAVGVTCGAR